MMPDQILFSTANFPPLGGGISHYLYEIVRCLPPDQVQVVGLPTPGWEVFDSQQRFSIRRLGVPARWSPSSPQFKFMPPFYFWRLACERQTRFIMCGQAHHSLLLPAWLLRQIKGTPYGVFTYGLDLLRPQTRAHRGLFSALLRAAQVVFAISQGTANTALGLGVKPERIRVIHPAVNPALLTSKTPPETVRQRHGLQGKKCILTVGRLVERKGFDTVIRALPAILEVIPEAHYLIVGGGPAEAGLKALVADLGLETYVTFAGPKSRDEVADYYLASDLFVMISREIPEKGDVEGFGIVYLEANLLGRPVVAGRSGGVADAVVHEETGLLVDPRDPAGVAAAVVRVLSDSDLAQRLGENGRSRVLSDFSGAAAAQKVLVALSDSCLAR